LYICITVLAVKHECKNSLMYVSGLCVDRWLEICDTEEVLQTTLPREWNQVCSLTLPSMLMQLNFIIKSIEII